MSIIAIVVCSLEGRLLPSFGGFSLFSSGHLATPDLLRLCSTRAINQLSISLSIQPTAWAPRDTGAGKVPDLMRS
jgi:hypothetical protein